ncbi:hypothetical protein F-VV10_0196 [Faustovirus]|nr:hypothetical protein F-VV10_0196 [Faustovirus]
MFSNNRTLMFIKLSPVDMVIRRNLYIQGCGGKNCTTASHLSSYYNLYGKYPTKVIFATYHSIDITDIQVDQDWNIKQSIPASYYNERDYLAIAPTHTGSDKVGSENYNIALEYLKNGVITVSDTLWIYGDVMIEPNMDWTQVHHCLSVSQEWVTSQKIHE